MDLQAKFELIWDHFWDVFPIGTNSQVRDHPCAINFFLFDTILTGFFLDLILAPVFKV